MTHTVSAAMPHDWHDSTTEKLTAIRQRRIRGDIRRVRAHARHPWLSRQSIVLDESDPSNPRQREIRVETCDLSAGGFAFYFKHYIHPGTQVTANFLGFADGGKLVGVVRNCIHVDAQRHRIGVEFTSRERARSPVSPHAAHAESMLSQNTENLVDEAWPQPELDGTETTAHAPDAAWQDVVPDEDGQTLDPLGPDDDAPLGQQDYDWLVSLEDPSADLFDEEILEQFEQMLHGEI